MRLLVVEDDARIAEPLLTGLREAGHRVAHATDGRRATEEARAGAYDALVLDVMLPGVDGFTVARTLRAERIATPIVFLTARGEVGDRVAGLDLGGDAYLVKPFDLTELLATLRAVARRGEASAGAVVAFAAGRAVLDTRDGSVTLDGHAVALTARERELLEALLRAPGRWFTREELLDRVWGPEFFGGARVVDVYVRYLRKKLGDATIESARGRGYRVP
jgi:DNA-binding response OmpR family regulator